MQDLTLIWFAALFAVIVGGEGVVVGEVAMEVAVIAEAPGLSHRLDRVSSLHQLPRRTSETVPE